ncbi:MAG: hypothetical protein KBD00_04520 [Candidatus Peribacteraceae bacterium]|nr:hypothetical protein [Candidatus Peribacteraceae bacterium]
MAENTQTNTGLSALGIQMPAGVDVYDSLMGDIELELVSTNLQHLDERYPNETPDARKARYQRYDKAYAAYDEAFKIWSQDFSQLVAKTKRDILSSAEQQDKKQEEEAMAKIDAAFTATPSPSKQ